MIEKQKTFLEEVRIEYTSDLKIDKTIGYRKCNKFQEEYYKKSKCRQITNVDKLKSNEEQVERK